MERVKSETGSVTVEATLCVTLFMIFALFLTTLFYTVYVQEAISHSVIQAGDSLSMEAYSTSKLQPDINTGVKSAISGLAVKLFSTSNSDEHFYTDQRWFSEDHLQKQYVDDPDLSTVKEEVHNVDLAAIVKQRFIGFFANGDEEYADKFLTKMGVVDGLDGLDFSKCHVSSGKLYITVNFKLKYLINIGGLAQLDVSQTHCAKIWQ